MDFDLPTSLGFRPRSTHMAVPDAHTLNQHGPAKAIHRKPGLPPDYIRELERLD